LTSGANAPGQHRRPADTARWMEGGTVVTVTDGRLTITNARSSTNNKICYIDIVRL
jgi:hypothetical protein